MGFFKFLDPFCTLELYYLFYPCGAMQSMSELKFKNHNTSESMLEDREEGKVKLTDLLSRLNKEKQREKKSNILLSVAAISAVSVFGIILSL